VPIGTPCGGAQRAIARCEHVLGVQIETGAFRTARRALAAWEFGPHDGDVPRRQAPNPATPPTSPPARKSMQAYLRCLHCHRNQSRHLRTGRGNWTCRYCHELNPGPALSDKVVAVRRTKPAATPAPAAAVPAPPPAPAPALPSPPAGGGPPTPARAARVSRGAPAAPAKPPRAAAPAKRAAAAAPATPPAERGFWDRLVFGGAE